MVVSYDRRDSGCSHGGSREELDAHATCRKTRLRSGEDVNAITLERAQVPAGGNYQDVRSVQEKLALPNAQPADAKRLGWTVVQSEPMQSMSHVNSSHKMHTDVVGQRSLDPQEKIMPISKPDDASINLLENWRAENCCQRSLGSSSENLPLDPKASAYKESSRQIRDRQQHTPTMDSSVLVENTVKPPSRSEDLRRARQLRKRVQDLRFQIQEQRDLLQSKQEARWDTDEQYIKRIRMMHVASQDPIKLDMAELTALETLWRLCQVARDECGPVEDALRSMEYRLEVEEAKLTRAEDRLYSQSDLPESVSPVVSLSQDDDEDLYGASSSSSLESTSEHEALYEDYLSRLGDQDILRESYEGLLNEKAMLEAEQERRRRVELDLDAEDLNFLTNFEEIAEPMRKDLEEVSEDVERLKHVCIEQGVIDATGRRTTTQHPNGDGGSETEIGETEERPQVELASKQSKPPQLQAPSGNNGLDSRTSGISAGHVRQGGFVNFWLLDKLQSSAMEVMILAGYVRARLKNMDIYAWKTEALRLWYHDGAGIVYETEKLEALSQISTAEELEKSVNEYKGDTMDVAVKAFSAKSTASRISVSVFEGFLGSRARVKSFATF